MNKRGVALVLAYMVTGVLIILSAGFISRSVSERNIVLRHVNSEKAFWLAEAGIARAIKDFPGSPLSGTLNYADSNTYAYNTTTVSDEASCTDCYRITSTGTVTLPSGNVITRNVVSIVQEPQSGAITNSITTTGDLTIGGSGYVEEPYESNASLSFSGVFGMTQAQLKAQADRVYTNPPNNVTPVNGITWIDITPGSTLDITSSLWSGSGILVVNGNLKITGGEFNGILWVSGTLNVAAGNPDIIGSVFVDCGASATTVLGNASIEFDADIVDGVLDDLSPIVKSWYEL